MSKMESQRIKIEEGELEGLEDVNDAVGPVHEWLQRRLDHEEIPIIEIEAREVGRRER